MALTVTVPAVPTGYVPALNGVPLTKYRTPVTDGIVIVSSSVP